MGDQDASERNPSPSQPRVGRRALVVGGLGGVVATALTRLGAAKAQEFDSQPLLVGQDNFAGATTGLFNEGPGAALRVENQDEGPGIQVLAHSLPAVQARSAGAGVVGVGGRLPNTTVITMTHTGVAGAGQRLGVLGAALPEMGTISISRELGVGLPVGVWGNGGSLGVSTVITATRTSKLRGVGVWGSAPALPTRGPYTVVLPPAGVVGTALGREQTAVLAHNPTGTALQVDGGIAVTCGGRGVVPRHSDSAKVADPSIKANSVVVVTLTGDPGNKGTSLHHVKVMDGEVQIALTGRPGRDLPFSYLCFDLA